MKRVLTLGLIALLAGGAIAVRAEETTALTESDFLTRVRRLTFDGRRTGEGYFSPDGSQMVLQSEREADNPFYQIYLLDMETGESRRVSNGTGKTTCAFIRPGTGDIEFGSTHLDPRSKELQQEEFDLRASGEERRYSWDYDSAMDIFVAPADGGDLVRLTDAVGYDAEASYSPDGDWIVFSSMRSAYDHQLTDDEQAMLEINPSYFAEIYIMRADGSEQTQLTDVPGYDGGPFFFPDGSRIIWRRFDEEGLTADVFSMKPDGTDVQKLTEFRAMSWAPYVHPSGEYVLFASNKLGFANFEVYMVDVAGTKEPVQITYTDGFDGLPVPTPDGKALVWTSTRHNGEGGQLYIGQWNHDTAMAALAAAPARGSQPTETATHD